jgi:hypothetical protein
LLRSESKKAPRKSQRDYEVGLFPQRFPFLAMTSKSKWSGRHYGLQLCLSELFVIMAFALLQQCSARNDAPEQGMFPRLLI